ncbi:MAG TPA: D-glycerate dehydrogenase [Actinobacteria bacterium]|nr:D-glycerate dehydrogenase [Actinomycetota bacterium]
MSRPMVVVTRRPPGRALEILEGVADVWVWPEDTEIPREVLLERVRDAEGLYSMLSERIDEELLDAAPRLRVVSNMAVGVDNVDLAACARRGIAVGHTPDVLTEATADLAWALLLTVARRVVEGVDHVRQGRWTRWEPGLLLGVDVYGTTLGIVGLGRIGTAVARRGRGFDMEIRYTARGPKPDVEAELAARYRELDELLAEADHVVVTAALTEETRGLIDAAALARMKPTATLVNVARGPLVDTEALVAALREGRIFGAGLDVTDPEPLPPDHPLLALPNCVVVPHVGSATRRTREAMAELAAENLVAGLEGRPLPAPCPFPEL